MADPAMPPCPRCDDVGYLYLDESAPMSAMFCDCVHGAVARLADTAGIAPPAEPITAGAVDSYYILAQRNLTRGQGTYLSTREQLDDARAAVHAFLVQNAGPDRREYQAIGEPHHSFVACQECFAVVVAGDRPHHDAWHNRMVGGASETDNGYG